MVRLQSPLEYKYWTKVRSLLYVVRPCSKQRNSSRGAVDRSRKAGTVSVYRWRYCTARNDSLSQRARTGKCRGISSRPRENRPVLFDHTKLAGRISVARLGFGSSGHVSFPAEAITRRRSGRSLSRVLSREEVGVGVGVGATQARRKSARPVRAAAAAARPVPAVKESNPHRQTEHSPRRRREKRGPDGWMAGLARASLLDWRALMRCAVAAAVVHCGDLWGSVAL
ncbi:hypothetical protein AXG93_4461s1140 [Marchantia polymorpha subsp. ruderalis]|uniref:Uncharacterized protein n=1 Tax=Marchantia polymorpha subsp. ruderalis TaxID=1480154 RepID=A0A176WRI6_MARPO|nr:hypothetical protein AXG93_4461s1140 [Marchantia polymorpha subsp. ruderalis]